MAKLAESLDPILNPPAATQDELAKLSAALDAELPEKALDRNLLVATWNIRAFGDMSDSWKRGKRDSPKRNRSDVLAIAEILSRFDVIAVQEARANLRALRHAIKALGQHWGLILTDVNPPPSGNGERLAFLFDTRRVRPSGLAAELVVPNEEIEKRGALDDGSLARQFVRTPYAVSFLSGGQTFILVTLHVIYGEKAEQRTGELAAIAEWLAGWAKRTSEDYNQNLICLGDFNIDRKDDPNYKALTSTGLRPPPELERHAGTVADGADPHFYDQIAWFTEGGKRRLTLRYDGEGHAGRFDWRPHLLTAMDTQEMTWHISDHFPLWVEFGIDGA